MSMGVDIHYEDDMFGCFNVCYENSYDFIDLGKSFQINNIELLYQNIIAIKIFATDEERLNLIQNSQSLEEAVHYCGDPISDDEEVALNILKEKLQPQANRRIIDDLKSMIATELAAKQARLSVESILSDLLLNTYGTNKIAEIEILSITNETKEMIQKIIKAYEEEIF